MNHFHVIEVVTYDAVAKIYTLMSETGELVASIDTAIDPDVNGVTGVITHPSGAEARRFSKLVKTPLLRFKPGPLTTRLATEAEIRAAGHEPETPINSFRDESGSTFVDISSEAERTYNFGSRGFVKIQGPQLLAVSDSGGHRIFSADGKSHYIPSGWIQLTWSVKEGEPNFVK